MSTFWSTGILAFWDDFETLLNGTVMCGAMIILMPAHNNLELLDGQASCGLGVRRIMPFVKDIGCSERDAAYMINCLLFSAFPFMAVYWRKQMRDMYAIKGSIIGDLGACVLCFPCMVMQEAREMKIRGGAQMSVPEQMHMNSR